MVTRWRAIFLASAGVFLALALAVSVGGVFPLERGLYQQITDGASPGALALFGWINYLGDKRGLIPATLLLLFLLPSQLRRRWWLWLGVMLATPLLEGLAKGAVARPRPEGLGMGFPSGHVSAAAAFFTLAAYLAGKSLSGRRAALTIWGLAALAVVLVAIARLVLRTHWPLDVIGGAALGIACAAAAAWWNERTA